eukprot:3716976-Amphidinium_carterae.1
MTTWDGLPLVPVSTFPDYGMTTLDGMQLLPNLWNDNSGWDADGNQNPRGCKASASTARAKKRECTHTARVTTMQA